MTCPFQEKAEKILFLFLFLEDMFGFNREEMEGGAGCAPYGFIMYHV